MGQPGGNGGFASAGDIQATVEEAVEQQGGAGRSVFFIRFYEGPASLVDRRSVRPATLLTSQQPISRRPVRIADRIHHFGP